MPDKVKILLTKNLNQDSDLRLFSQFGNHGSQMGNNSQLQRSRDSEIAIKPNNHLPSLTRVPTHRDRALSEMFSKHNNSQ